jgi:hypothetical protein
MPWKPLDEQEKEAKKVLGDKAKMPRRKVDIQALVTKANDVIHKFKQGRDKMEDLVESLEDALDAYKNGVKRVAIDYEADDFGLDRKNKDDVKNIEEAHKIFSAFFDQKLTEVTDDEKALDELEKHLASIKDYKGPCICK